MLSLALCAGACGCGTRTYLYRLNQTKRYHAYLERLNDNLHRPWSSIDQAVTLRVPLQFEVIPPPAAETDEEGNPLPIPPSRDPRQPDFLGTHLPGLLGAWKTRQPLELVAGNRPARADAYMYVLSNWELWKSAETAKSAVDFQTDLTGVLTSGLRVSLPEDDQWQTSRYPAAGGYVQPKEFISVTLSPPHPIHGAATDVFLHLYQTGRPGAEIQVAILFVIPQGYDSRQKLPERMALCLETLTVATEKPGRFSGPGAASPTNF